MKGSHFSITVVLLMTFILTACSSAAAQIAAPATEAYKEIKSAPSPGVAELQLPERDDNQGNVAVNVRPLPWTDQSEEVVFEISLNTHSVDLAFDLANLAVLSTDTGINAQAIRWDAPGGGHHVAGKLSFPARVNGKSLFDGATELKLTIKGVDVPERVFTWVLLR